MVPSTVASRRSSVPRASAAPARRRWRVGVVLIVGMVALARLALAQEVGTVAELDGSADVGRGGTWTPAASGMLVHLGDTLRTARPGRVRVVFRDDSVLTVADASEFTIDELTVDQERGIARTVLRLLQGKVRALVGEYYERPQSQFQVETQTAVVGVRGTDFVLTFDPAAQTSDVVGVSGRVEVHSILDRVGHAVFITAREITTVTRGVYPTPPRRLADEIFRQYFEQLGFIGHGQAESLAAAQPVIAGTGVPEADRAAALPAPAGAVGTLAPAAAIGIQDAARTASGLIQQPAPVIEAPQGKVGIRF